MKTLLGVAALLVATTAWAQTGAPPTKEAQAKLRFERGQELVAKHQYQQAIEHFQAGYELTKRPLFLFNIAECARLLGDRARARATYEQYLREDPRGPMVGMARIRLTELGVGRGSGAAVAAPIAVAPRATVSVPPAPMVVAPRAPVPAPPAAPSPPAVPAPTRPPGSPPPAAARPGASPPSVALTLPSAYQPTAPTVGLDRRPTPETSAPRPFWKRGPFWVGVGTAVVAASVTTIAVTTARGGHSVPSGAVVDLRKP